MCWCDCWLVGFDEFDNVEFGDEEGFKMNDLDGVEWTELTAARYCEWKKKDEKKRRKEKPNRYVIALAAKGKLTR